MYLHSVMFELELIRSTESSESDLKQITDADLDKTTSTSPMSMRLARRGSQGTRNILLKGQMRYIDDVKAIIFLCSPL